VTREYYCLSGNGGASYGGVVQIYLLQLILINGKTKWKLIEDYSRSVFESLLCHNKRLEHFAIFWINRLTIAKGKQFYRQIWVGFDWVCFA